MDVSSWVKDREDGGCCFCSGGVREDEEGGGGRGRGRWVVEERGVLQEGQGV